MSSSRSHTQVLVIGGGPAGSTAAALLAREGFEVTLVERDFFPRYHIGESLLPTVLEFLDLTGAREKVEAYGFQRKPGGHIEWGSQHWDLFFNELSGDLTYSFQVIRSEFDQVLLDHAASLGVQVLQGVEVQKVHFDEADGERPIAATVAPANGSGQRRDISFDYLVDASGRAGIMATRYLRNRRFHETFKNVAIWGYWDDAARLPSPKEGAIATISFPEGWIWAIPLHDGTLSVGVVMHKDSFKEKRETQSLEEIYFNAINESTTIQDLVTPGRLTTPQLKVETDYSYASQQFAGPGYFMIGDAACFLDPLLSTGVHLAMLSAVLASVSISSHFRGEVSEREAIDFFDESFRSAYLRLLVFLSAFYNQYDGKDSIFWMARQLSNHDAGGENLKIAFTALVSGVEDLKDIRDAGDAARRRVLEEMSQRVEENLAMRKDKRYLIKVSPEEKQRRLQNQAFFNQVEGINVIALTPESAVQGFYVVTRPRLGLARVASLNGHNGHT